MEKVGPACSGDNNLYDNDETDQRTAVVTVGASPFYVISLGCTGYFIHGGKVHCYHWGNTANSIFCFQAFITLPRSIKQKKRGLSSISKIVRSFAI